MRWSSEEFDEYGIIIHDDGPSYSRIHHYPWCGVKLPESQRERYFAEIEALGFESANDDAGIYHTAAWRKRMQ
jgi:hypothetical protein